MFTIAQFNFFIFFGLNKQSFNISSQFLFFQQNINISSQLSPIQVFPHFHYLSSSTPFTFIFSLQLVSYLLIIDYFPVTLQLTPAVNNQNHNIQTITMRQILPYLLLISLPLLCLSANDMTFNRVANAANTRSSIQLTYASAGSIVSGILSQTGGSSNDCIILLWAPYTSYPNDSPEQEFSMRGSGTFYSNPLQLSGNYRIEILPLNEKNQFPFNMNIQIDNVTVAKYVDSARYDRVFAIYHFNNGNYQASATAPSTFASSVSVQVYGPFQTLQVSGGSLASSSLSNNGIANTYLYSTKGKQYFYVVVKVKDNYLASGQYITIKYQTDAYSCPYDPSSFSDYNSIYQGCMGNQDTNSISCNSYDSQTGKCSSCYQPWVLSKDGFCIQNTSCPDGQYYMYGKCYDAIDNCSKFQFFGGLCTACNDGYTLKSDFTGAQACEKMLPKCKLNQYLMGDRCYTYVSDCADFQSNTATCVTCKAGYDLINNQCKIKISNPLNCPLGQKNMNNKCVAIDQHCIFFHNNNTCMLCAKGYLVKSGLCDKIICGPRQFSQYGTCTDVSSFCNEFDPIYGNCLTCITFYFLQNDGTCLQVLTSQMTYSPSVADPSQQNSCPDRYYKREDTCVEVSSSCDSYDRSSGKCLSCIDRNHFLNTSAGTCIDTSSFCGYRLYFSNGQCLPVSKLCDQFNPSTGQCLSCLDGANLLESGRCQLGIPCADRQYRNYDGNCVKVSDKCDTYDPINGQCLSCKDQHELNEGGICCYPFNYLLDQKCIPFFASNCHTQRPHFNNCLKCKQGHALTRGLFGRCNKI